VRLCVGVAVLGSLKGNLTDQRVLQALTELADEYDALAAKLDGKA
jgi:hypothetical protein